MRGSTFVLSFKVKPGRDDDIICWIKGLPERERSVCIRMALREWLGKDMRAAAKEGRVAIKAPVTMDTELKNSQHEDIDQELLNQRLDKFKF